jgi:dihydropyrimidinase
LTDVAGRYAELLAAGELKPDAAQAAVVARLAALETALNRPVETPGLIGRLFGKAPPDAPKGLYIWGGVGRGKSMAMDLYFSASAVSPKRRSHFHEFMAEVHNTLSEELAFNRVIRLAENVEGCALYMVHVSAATGVAALANSRARGFPMYGETLHQYLMYTAEDYKKPNGQIYHTYPSLKYPEDQKKLWEATNRGALQVIATDELCCPLRIKLQGSRIDDTTGGNSGVEPRVGLMYTQMVTKRGYTPEHFVDMVSTNAAKIMGLYPRKGALAVGSDADVVVLETGIDKTIRAEDMHETDYTPWEGHKVTAWPRVTVMRGRVVVEDGVFSGDLKQGEFLPRKIPDEVRSRPAV